MHHAFTPEYPAGVRFRKYDGGGELSSCFSVREDRIAMADIFIQLGICKSVYIKGIALNRVLAGHLLIKYCFYNGICKCSTK